MIAALVGLTILILFTFVLPILSFLRSREAVRRIERLQQQVEQLERVVAKLSHEGTAASGPASTETAEAAPSVPGAEPSVSASPDRWVSISPEPAPREPAAARIDPSPPVPRPATEAPETLEARIGSRWLLYVGIAAIVIGASYFVKYAFDNEWITPVMQVAIGAVAGVSLVYLGMSFIRRGFDLYGQILAGGGIAIVYLSIYAALTFYALIGQATAFAAMAIVTAMAATLADRAHAQGLALTAVIGGFVTPFLVGGEAESPVPLFTYDAILVAGTIFLARRRAWPALNLASYGLTVLTIAAWMLSSYRSGRWLATELFLTLFVGMYLYVLRESFRSSELTARLAGVVLATAPLLYHAASIGILFGRFAAFQAYLVAVTLAGLLIARESSAYIRLAIWLAVVLPFLGWLTIHQRNVGFVLPLVCISAIYLMHLLTAWPRLRDDAMSRGEIALLHGNGLMLLAAGSIVVENEARLTLAFLAAALAVWNGALAGFLRRDARGASYHFLALGGAMLAVAIAQQFDGAWVTVGWAAEGAGLMWIALSERRSWLRVAGGALFGLATLQFLALMTAAVPANYVVVFNQRAAAGAFLIGLLYGLAWLHGRAATGSWSRRRANVALVIANLFTLLLATHEIDAYWRLHGSGRTGYLAGQTTISIAWATYGVGLIVVGIQRRNRPLRYLAIAILGVTIGKVFFVDLSELDRIYRILSVLVLGLLLLVASYLYQRYRSRIAAPDDRAAEAP